MRGQSVAATLTRVQSPVPVQASKTPAILCRNISDFPNRRMHAKATAKHALIWYNQL
jgi:hypothetical protein